MMSSDTDMGAPDGRRVRGSALAASSSKASKTSMFMRIRQAQITGTSPSWNSVQDGAPRRATPMAAGAARMRLLGLPPVDALVPVMSKTHQRMLKQIRHLEDLLDNGKLVDIVVPLQTISRSIIPPSGTTTRKDDRDNFIQMGGPEVLLRITYAILEDDTMELFAGAHGSDTPPTNVAYSYQDESNANRRRARAPSTDAASQDKLTALAESMNFLRELCFIAPAVAERLGCDDHLTIVLFQLMSNGLFFEHAAGLAEEILSIREDSFDLSLVPNVQQIMLSFSTRQLAFFCRILALIVFEPEDRRLLENSRVIKSIELLRLRRERMQKTDNTVDRNHALLFQTPTVLHRFIVVLQLQNYFFSINPSYDPFSPELQSSTELAMLFSLEQHEEWAMFAQPLVAEVMDDAMHGRTLTSAPSDAAGFVHLSSTYFRSLLARSRLAMPAPGHTRSDVEVELMLKSISLAPFRVEVLFVICTLLSSKRKVDFQDTFANMGLVAILTQMFQRLEWNAPPASPPSQPLHGPGCECSMDASLKIQFLRLIHNFCDRDVQEQGNKLLLLTPEEQRSLRGHSGLDPLRAEKGLLCQIIDVLCDQPSDSIYRFWLASCVESFLRRASPDEQLFVARSPLLPALLKEILGAGFKPSGSLQSAFDLLGEMTKNNATTLVLFNDALDDLQFANLMHVVVTNLVDSNVFVRSLLLSVEHRAEDLALQPSLHRLFAFLDVNAVRLLRDLMGIVTMDDINHENICCLNTAVVMLVFEHRKQRLPGMLEALRQHDAEVGATPLCTNFRHLLWFWVQYYVPRGRDRLSLEHSSDMKFREWYAVVALLCADDGSPAALLPSPPTLPASPYSMYYTGPRPARV
ncbi:hypothetical protein ACHHYP_13426 [Achlya hypogyna]|uniref:Short transient receptor potential channel 4-associated protein n=1 Tax=Achlya hypogyna TaxID=1202772 RepID=A0A1V9YF71_ACHHY|nr:hypothetical protein ACHHYP_13426 [Achlya hypogyna]